MKRLIISTVVSICSACSTAPIQLTNVGGEERIQAADIVDIAIDPREFTRVDTYFNMFNSPVRNGIETGPYWQRVFRGDGRNGVLFSITRASMRSTIEAAGFVARFTYSIDGQINLDGMQYPIHAEGTRAAGMMMLSAMRQAVELGVLHAAQQATALTNFRKQRDDSLPEPAR